VDFLQFNALTSDYTPQIHCNQMALNLDQLIECLEQTTQQLQTLELLFKAIVQEQRKQSAENKER
jgi:hypothetical protein